MSADAIIYAQYWYCWRLGIGTCTGTWTTGTGTGTRFWVLDTRLSFAIYVQCCRHHAVGQRVVSDLGVVRKCWSICSMCSESNNANTLLHLSIAVYLEHYILVTYQTHLDLQHGGWYLVIIDGEFSDVTLHHIYCQPVRSHHKHYGKHVKHKK